MGPEQERQARQPQPAEQSPSLPKSDRDKKVEKLKSEGHALEAPFTPDQAKAAQEKWAEELGVPPTFTNSLGMKFTLIPPGRYTMGTPGSEPGRDGDETAHTVELSRPIYIGTYEVSQGEFGMLAGANPSYNQGSPKLPVDSVTWFHADAFCKALSSLPDEKSNGRHYRLPTEAEWEFCCRAGTKTAAHVGDNLTGDNARILSDQVQMRSQMGLPLTVTPSKTPIEERKGPFKPQPNAFGLHFMHGNVEEWCHDYYAADYYQRSPERDPKGPAQGEERVVRGGSFASQPRAARSGARESASPTSRDHGRGFRVVLDIR